MKHIPKSAPVLAPAQRDVAANRSCLRCRTVFASEGFGERICQRCKVTVAWRAGLPAGTGQNRRRSVGGAG